jgi:hypothetical protein
VCTAHLFHSGKHEYIKMAQLAGISISSYHCYDTAGQSNRLGATLSKMERDQIAAMLGNEMQRLEHLYHGCGSLLPSLSGQNSSLNSAVNTRVAIFKKYLDDQENERGY